LAAGTYTVSSTIFFDTDTVIIGDAANPPTIKAAAGFNGDYLIVGGQGDGDSHPCGGSGGETHFSVMSKSIFSSNSYQYAMANSPSLQSRTSFWTRLPMLAPLALLLSAGLWPRTALW
jgi:hypothetical protein